MKDFANLIYSGDIYTLHYFLIIVLGFALCISILILSYTIMHNNATGTTNNAKRIALNSWQFPMLLALFIESVVFYYM